MLSKQCYVILQDDTILAGVNASEEMIKKGENSNCRVFKAHEAT